MIIVQDYTYHNVVPGVSGTKENKGEKEKKMDQGEPIQNSTLSTGGTRKEKVLLYFWFFGYFKQNTSITSLK